MLGREITLLLQVVIESPKEILEAPDVNEYVQEMQTRMNLPHEITRKPLKRKTQYKKRYYDTKSRKIFFPIGQPVWLHDQPQRLVYIINCLQKGRVLTVSSGKLMTFSTLLRKVQSRHPRHSILIDFYPIGVKIFRNGSNQIINKLGGSNCVKVLSTFHVLCIQM